MLSAFSFFTIVILVIFFTANADDKIPIVEEIKVVEYDVPEPKVVEEIDTDDIESLRKLSESELIHHGNDFTFNRFYAESIILYEIALEKNPNSLDALNGLGYSLSKVHASNDAIIHYTKVLNLDPTNINAHNGMGVAYADLEQYGEATSYFEKSLKIDKNNVNAYNGLGFTNANLGLYGESVEYFTKSLNLDPLRVETHNGIAFSFFQSGQTNRAIGSYERALEIDPNNLDAMLGLALVLSETGQDDRAAKLIETARTISSTIDSQFLNKIIMQGNILVDSGEYKNAIIFYDRVLKLYDNINALNGKATALMKLGSYDEAMILLDKVIKVDPSNKNAQNIKKLIQEYQN